MQNSSISRCSFSVFADAMDRLRTNVDDMVRNLEELEAPDVVAVQVATSMALDSVVQAWTRVRAPQQLFPNLGGSLS